MGNNRFRILGIGGNRNNSSKIKPVHVMNQEGLPDLEKQAVLDGASELIRLANVSGVELIDFGFWKNNNYIDSEGYLEPYQSMDWYLQMGRVRSRNKEQLDVDAMQYALFSEPWRDVQEGGKDHYDILVVHEDIYSGDYDFVIGMAARGIGTTLSTHRFKELDENLRYECVKTETMHELGHVFGLIPDKRTKNIEYSLGKHCTNRCTMRLYRFRTYVLP